MGGQHRVRRWRRCAAAPSGRGCWPGRPNRRRRGTCTVRVGSACRRTSVVASAPIGAGGSTTFSVPRLRSSWRPASSMSAGGEEQAAVGRDARGTGRGACPRPGPAGGCSRPRALSGRCVDGSIVTYGRERTCRPPSAAARSCTSSWSSGELLVASRSSSSGGRLTVAGTAGLCCEGGGELAQVGRGPARRRRSSRRAGRPAGCSPRSTRATDIGTTVTVSSVRSTKLSSEATESPRRAELEGHGIEPGRAEAEARRRGCRRRSCARWAR